MWPTNLSSVPLPNKNILSLILKEMCDTWPSMDSSDGQGEFTMGSCSESFSLQMLECFLLCSRTLRASKLKGASVTEHKSQKQHFYRWPRKKRKKKKLTQVMLPFCWFIVIEEENLRQFFLKIGPRDSCQNHQGTLVKATQSPVRISGTWAWKPAAFTSSPQGIRKSHQRKRTSALEQWSLRHFAYILQKILEKSR